MAINIVQKFIVTAGINIHYRQAGTGPLLFILHPSPRSSKMMEPLLQLLATQFTVVAPDMPGYGYSNPLPKTATSIYDYVEYLHAFINTHTTTPVTIYGTATGAQLAIAYGLKHSANVKYLYLDNAAHFSDAACDVLLENYFPDFTPQADGSHLQKIWAHVCDSFLYFPWYEKNNLHQFNTTLPPPAVIQAVVDDYVLAGQHYADAYKAAFKHERVAHVQQLKCNTTIFKWLGSPLLQHIEALVQHNLPANTKVITTPVTIAERYAVMKEAIINNM
jgi:pimeloyl-ACP methyl ester carboxylesterase